MLGVVITFVTFFGGFLALAMASAYLFERRKTDANYVTFAFLCSMGIWQIYHGLMISGILFMYPHFALVHVPFLYISAPLLYFYYQILTRDDFSFKKRDMIHFIPVVFILVSVFPFYIKSGGEKLELLQSFAGLRGRPEVFPVYPYLVMTVLAAICIYACGFSRDILRIYREKLISGRDTTFYSIVIIAFNFAMIIVYITGFLVVKIFYSGQYYLAIIKAIAIIMTMEMYFILLLKWRYPDYMKRIRDGARKIRYATSRIEKVDVEGVLDSLRDLMENQKVFCDEEVSLSRLADELDITPYQLSQILNERLNKNFNTYINEYRVREAETYLLDNNRRSVMSISFAVGFNTVTSFYNAFDRIHQMTPAQFRNKMKK